MKQVGLYNIRHTHECYISYLSYLIYSGLNKYANIKLLLNVLSIKLTAFFRIIIFDLKHEIICL